MKAMIHETQAVWRVWSRSGRRQPWRVVATAASKPAAAKAMFDLMTDLGGDWLVTAPDAADPNTRPAHLRR